MTPLQDFCLRYDIEPRDAEHFQHLGTLRASWLEHECNGDPHPVNHDKSDKNTNAELWGKDAAMAGDRMTRIVKEWGFDRLDFGVGLYPTLELPTTTEYFPWDK